MGKVMIAFLLVVGCLVAVTLATMCQESRSDKECMMIRVKCRAINESECVGEGGDYYPRGGFCHYCDTCGKFVDAGAPCNTTLQGSSIVTALCKSPYICSARGDGICVLPTDCTESNE